MSLSNVITYFNTFYQTFDSSQKTIIDQGNIYVNKELVAYIFPRISEIAIGAILISNACDFAYNRLKYISLLPIYKVSKNILPIPASTDKKSEKWYKVITLNHSLLFYLPPISDHFQPNGAVINFQKLGSIKIDLFNELSPSIDLVLNSTYINRLTSKVSNLFNRIPINHPQKSDIEIFIKNLHEINL